MRRQNPPETSPWPALQASHGIIYSVSSRHLSLVFFVVSRVDLNLRHEYIMETSCFLSCLSKHKETCGNSRGVTESVRLEDFDESITNHLRMNTCHLSRETLKESQLILARAGIFDFPVSKLSEMMICSKHRHTLGKYWKQRRPCQYLTHKGRLIAVKTRDVVNVVMAKEILKLHEVVVAIGSGLLSTFSHFYIITLSRRIK